LEFQQDYLSTVSDWLTIVASCNYELPQNKVPNSADPISCSRCPWGGAEDGYCILHTSDRVTDVGKLESEINKADRIDGLQLNRQELSEKFIFEDMELYGGNFQNASLKKCMFINTSIYHSRFEGAELDNAIFSKQNKEKLKNINSPVENRIPIRYCSFNDTNLNGAIFNQVNFVKTDLHAKNMIGIEMIDCSLPDINFNGLNMSHSDFSFSFLRNTSFERCNLKESTFHATILENTRFIDVNIYNADFRNAILDETDFKDVEIDHRTKFDSILVQEYLSDRYNEGRLSLNTIKNIKNYLHNRREEVPIKFEDLILDRGVFKKIFYGIRRLISRRPRTKKSIDYKHLEHARYRYRDLAGIFKNNDEPETAREYSIREKHAKRKNSLKDNKSSWPWLAFTRWTMKYGEEPIQPLKAALALVIVSAVLYPLLGVQYVESKEQLIYCSCFSLPATFSVIHLSVVRLVSVSNTAIQPINLGVVLAVLESIGGALLTAMFVFTLGRRATE